MTQFSLFAPEPAARAPRPPDLAFIRKTLGWRLRIARNAAILPWGVAETESLERRLPELARLLPEDEANAFIAAFTAELTRLRAVD